MSDPRLNFQGAKLMVFAGEQLIVLRRDRKPTIPWPGYLDFPGGEREGNEAPETCALRETQEEVGLMISPDVLQFAHLRDTSGHVSWFFAAHLPASAIDDVVFGDEGEGWDVMSTQAYISAQDGIPHFQGILSDYLVKKPGPVR